ncbi:uncharacterized protein I303_102411 [Kwoniella dejecticola CBS 10117]|uniref:Uncharacterized protein n=1 Tax=Kwoniella dejecticola CBS 10117 TaxID=1296121 RepID=A0A1A6A8N5_9TREE|nr:uncharacterized protein I303_02425 [Kwoniella dejecticola CBS 10117]OBR86418.1 hypothetical protein I303_02425 [Kwoniella dejecticola CBS 10117]
MHRESKDLKMLTKTTFAQLPLEIVTHILDGLQISRQLGALAAFRQTSKYHYELATPYLYKRLIISHVALVKHLKFIDKYTSSTCELSSIESTGYARRLRNVQYTKLLTLTEVELEPEDFWEQCY